MHDTGETLKHTTAAKYVKVPTRDSTSRFRFFRALLNSKETTKLMQYDRVFFKKSASQRR